MAKDRGEDMRSDTGAYNSEEVESSVAKHLAALAGDSDDPASTPEPEDRDDDDLEPDDDSTPAEDDDDEPAEDDQDDETDDDDGEPAEGEDEHAIPENVLRSLEHNEWTPEEISEFFKADPKKAMKVFNKIHEATNNMSRQFAALGRKRIELERQQPQKQQMDEPAKPQDFVDVEALRRDDPDNPLLPVIEGMNKALKQLAPQRQSEPADGPQQSQQDDLALATQIVTFLGSDHLKAYNDFYGPAYDDVGMPTFDDRALMPGQRANRQALIDEADAIYVGAKLHGRELTVAEALQKAHSLLTEPMRSRKTREELVGKVRKRGKGLTLPPSKSGKPKTEPTGKPRSSAELESRTAARLEKFRRGR